MGDAERKPVPGGLSTGLGRAAVADPAANQWGARIVAVPGSRAEGVDSLVWFSDANAMVSTMSVEIPLWNVDASNEEDTYRAQQLAGLGQRILHKGVKRLCGFGNTQLALRDQLKPQGRQHGTQLRHLAPVVGCQNNLHQIQPRYL